MEINELKNYLDLHNVNYTLYQVPAGTGNSVAEHIQAFGLTFADGCSTLIFSTDKGFVALLRRDDTRVNSKKFKQLLGARDVRVATAEELKRETGFAPGMVSPVNLQLPVYIDDKVLEKDEVRVGTGGNEYSLAIDTKDLQRVTNAQVVNVCEIDPAKGTTAKKRILTGDRPTGPLHIGHLVGSLQNRVELQDEFDTYILIADVQALTDNYENPEKVRANVLEVYKDNIAVGLDPAKVKFFIQSQVPAIAELTVYFMNLVTHNEVLRNPTVKTEIAQKGYAESVPFGFVAYPVSQAADILCVKGELVPVGEDQLPMIELTAQIARRFNRIYGVEVFPEPQVKLSEIRRLCGTDGNAKMGKSLGNVINLKDSEAELKQKVMNMFTDPNRIHATDPGKVEGNPVFIYHDVFNDDLDEVNDLKARYQAGTVGDVEVKEKLFAAMNKVLAPIRESRAELDAMDQGELMQQLLENTAQVRAEAEKTLAEVKAAMQITFLSTS